MSADNGRDRTRASVSHRDGSAFGELVRERRMSIGLTQRELADAAGMSIGALRDLEQGRTRCPRWGAVAAFAAALGMDRHRRAELASAWSGGQPGEGSGYGPLESEAAGAGGTGVRIGVLGLLTVLRGRAVVELGSSRQRAVLGLLALHGPTGVSRDVIVDVLWGERPPRSATAEVQAYVSRLRRLLDPGKVCGGPGGPVMLASRRYRLDGAIDLDLAEFGQLSRKADAATAQGESRIACALYERSLGLWRGEVLADVDLLRDYPGAVEATRRRGDVILRYAHAATAAGRCERLLPYLRDLCAHDPFNEEAHAHLMTVLAAAGQQAAAVRLFGELRRRLDHELGIRPGRQLAATHLRILRRRPGNHPA